MIRRRAAIILAGIILVIFVGTAGYMTIEAWSVSEALYMTVITVSTVGFGEVKPLSDGGRVFTVMLILGGILLIATGANFLFSSIMEGTFRDIFRRQSMEKKISRMKDHFIICGLGAVGEDIIQEFARTREPFVLVEKARDVLERFVRENHEILHVIGDATHDEALKNAGIERAKGIIAALGNDADNLYICLSARALNPKLRIISRVIESDSIDKMKKAGADYVFSPEKIGGIHLASAALRPTVMSFLDAIIRGQHLNLVLDEVTVEATSEVAGKTLREAAIAKNIGIVIPAIKSAKLNKLTFNPSPDSVIGAGDTLISFGTPQQLKQLRKMCT
ncbi:MAG: potassium channel protein [candidate division WOR-3 bacterium]|nr:MAG: potassium channel protein [candidate division WOR-3 bacterium]